MEDAAVIVMLIVGFALVVLVVSLMVYFPVSVAKRNGHPNPNGVSALALVGLFIWPCWIGAVIWAYVGGRPEKQSGNIVETNANRERSLASVPRDPAPFDIIGKDAKGKQIRLSVEALDESEARFAAADKGIEVLAIRKGQPKPSWHVAGRDVSGREHRLRVNGDSREAAFAEASKRGIVQAHSIERA